MRAGHAGLAREARHRGGDTRQHQDQHKDERPGEDATIVHENIPIEPTCGPTCGKWHGALLLVFLISWSNIYRIRDRREIRRNRGLRAGKARAFWVEGRPWNGEKYYVPVRVLHRNSGIYPSQVLVDKALIAPGKTPVRRGRPQVRAGRGREPGNAGNAMTFSFPPRTRALASQLTLS